MIKAYIAAPYQCREQAKNLADMLAADGVIITARWLIEGNELSEEWALNDLDDVRAADVLIALNPEEWKNKGTGGRNVELGYALAYHKCIVLIGVRSNIFHYLSAVHVIAEGVNVAERIKRLVNHTQPEKPLPSLETVNKIRAQHGLPPMKKVIPLP